MTKSRFIRTLIMLIITFNFTNCDNEEFEVPSPEPQIIELSGAEISISALREALEQQIITSGNTLLLVEDDLYVSGYVISTDEQGNFFEELIIQDNYIEPDAGLRIKLDANPLYQSFEPGRKVYIRLSGLTAGMDSGQLTVGYRDGNRIGQISESRMFQFVIRDTVVRTIEPLAAPISTLDETYINTYIKLSDVQFHRDEVLGDYPLTFAGEAFDEFDGERTLESCSETSSIVLSTSVYASFSSSHLPAGRGNAEGIFTYNFYGDEFNLVLNDLNGLDMESTDRCDPMLVDCGVAVGSGITVLFSEFFESQSEGEPIQGNGWTNYVEAGSETWEAYFEDGTNASLGISARMGSYLSGDDDNIGWLITPEIQFDSQQGEELHFKTSNSFADESTLELLFSSDWNGEPDTVPNATWQILTHAIIVEDDDFFGDWVFSGYVDLSCIEGSGHIAWRYTGSGDADEDGTYELDEIEITSN